MAFSFVSRCMPDPEASAEMIGRVEIRRPEEACLQDLDPFHSLKGKGASSLSFDVVADYIPAAVKLGEVERTELAGFPEVTVDLR